MTTASFNQLPPQVVIYGGTGQAKVNRPIIEHFGSRVAAVIDDTAGLAPPFDDIDLLAGWIGFEEWLRGRTDRNRIGFCIAIGNPHGRVRLSLHDRLLAAGLVPVSLAHPTAWIEPGARVGDGAQIMAGAIIMAKATIGKQCIINTKASVDHESVLGDGTEIAPGATLCGDVQTGTNAWVCAGATVLPRCRIGDDAIVGAGAVVTQNVEAGMTVIGVPAKAMRTEKGIA